MLGLMLGCVLGSMPGIYARMRARMRCQEAERRPAQGPMIGLPGPGSEGYAHESAQGPGSAESGDRLGPTHPV